MKQKDHKALGIYLLDSVGVGVLERGTWHRRFFLLGCVGPDYIPFTYLRGFRQSRAMRGHDLPYSDAHIQKSIVRLQKSGVRSFHDSFALGTLMHYLADSFTFVHTEAFTGNMRAHRLYEKDLHKRFSAFLARERRHSMGVVRYSEQPLDFLERGREEYRSGKPSAERDCRQIIHACTGVFHTLSFHHS